jgi:hypothetical protein
MPIVPNSTSYRLDQPEKQFEPSQVELPDEDNSSSIDEATGARITVDEDGGVTIDMNPSVARKPKSNKFNANLAEDLTDAELSDVATEILRGVQSDIDSRALWSSAYDKGITLMGLKLEDASSEVSATGSISKVYNQLLIEATVRYQSTSMAELLPASGPVKVRDDSTDDTNQARVELANDFETDFNYYLTVVAREYYPDTDQLLFNQGWSGMAFKKIYECPLRKRPVSDLVLAPDLIVSNDTVDLETATRITHRTYMSNAVVRRMQKAGYYRKVDLGQPVEQPTQVEQKVAEVENITISSKLPTDNRHTIYETYIELDLPGHEKDIPLPYCVSIDFDSQKILSIYRNWEEKDEDCRAECKFVKFGMIPALGFYDLGFVHLLGNTTRALTAILRMQLDAGQFSIFPGFLFSKQGGRQVTTEIRLSPGSGKEIDTGGLPIQQVAMPLPYPGPSSVLAAIYKDTAADGMRLGMASEVQVGEGRADVPVGTTMALIEQATKVMAAVHKRNHVSQQREFEKLRKLFNKNPEALSKFSKNPARKWQTAEEFADLELVPASDPNIPSHTHRLMQATALVQLASASPDVFNKRAVATRALATLGYKDIDNLLAPLPPPGAPPPPPPPEIMLKMQDNDIKKQQIQLSAQQQASHDESRLQEMQMDAVNKAKDRESRENIEKIKLAGERDKHEKQIQLETTKHFSGLMSDHLKHDSKLNADHMANRGGIISEHKKHANEIISSHIMQDKELEARADENKIAPKD